MTIIQMIGRLVRVRDHVAGADAACMNCLHAQAMLEDLIRELEVIKDRREEL